MISQLNCTRDDNEQLQKLWDETQEKNNENSHQPRRSLLVLDQDLNCLPYFEPLEDQSIDNTSPGRMEVSDIGEKKRKRAASEHIARIALSDLAKYFDLPIVEASKNLKVGLTVLKKKCREFGIPRWPHRKIKSLDSLIHDLQEETKRQQQENMAAAIAVAKRQRMLECEKETIEKKPYLDMKSETKRFRQDVFKRRHRSRALGIQGLTISSN